MDVRLLIAIDIVVMYLSGKGSILELARKYNVSSYIIFGWIITYYDEAENYILARKYMKIEKGKIAQHPYTKKFKYVICNLYRLGVGTIAEMIHDSGMLCGYDFDKIIPCYESMNRILSQGYYARLVEWESIEIDSKEYNNVVEELLAMKLDRPYRLGMDD